MPAVLEAPPLLSEAASRLTVAEFRAMEFDDDDKALYYELLEGNIFPKSANSPYHQRVSGNIIFAVSLLLENRNLGGEVFFGPLGVVLSEENLALPDILYIGEDRMQIIQEEAVEGSPNLIMEILANETVKLDRGIKKRIYEHFGIDEYWLVDIRTRSVEVYVNATFKGRNEYELREIYSVDERNPESPVTVRSVVLEGLELPLDVVFDGV